MTRFVTLVLFVVLGAVLYLYSVVYISHAFSPNQRIALWLDPFVRQRIRDLVWSEFWRFGSLLASALPFAVLIAWTCPRRWFTLSFGITIGGLIALLLPSWDRTYSVVPLCQQILMLLRVGEFVTVLPFVTWVVVQCAGSQGQGLLPSCLVESRLKQ